MADYYPLLARALEGLPENTPEARAVVFDRAKAALVGQLRNVKPPLGEDAIERETDSLREAIARIEQEQERALQPEPAPATPETVARPKVDATRIRPGGRRIRPVLTALALVAVIMPIAVIAFLWRDQPRKDAASTTPTPTQQPAAGGGADPKFSERVGSGSAPGEGVPAAPSRVASSDEAGRAAQPPGDVVVAQKAALVEENSQDPKQPPKITSGRALWRLDAVNAGQGQPLENVVRATVEVPDAQLSLQLVLKKNRDAALPASHTLELTFSTAGSDPGRAVRDVNPPLFRPDDGSRGVPVAALSVPVKENVFLIGLSDLRGDLERNLDLLGTRNWIEVPLRFASGGRATLVFEKGVTGDRVVGDALKAWAQP